MSSLKTSTKNMSENADSLRLLIDTVDGIIKTSIQEDEYVMVDQELFEILGLAFSQYCDSCPSL